MKFSFKIFKYGKDTLLAISDFSILGKTFEDGDMQLNVSRDFYFEKTCDEKSIKRLIESATIVNAVGKNIINLMIKEKMIKKDDILEICGVPHAQIITI
ncbi:MAG: DUF424 family protein [Candidatus Aenigmatarchaeota archaeon]